MAPNICQGKRFPILTGHLPFRNLIRSSPKYTRKKKTENLSVFGLGPSDWIRTSGLLNPIQARYQTSPHPDIFLCPAGLAYNSTGFQKNQVLFFVFLNYFLAGCTVRRTCAIMDSPKGVIHMGSWFSNFHIHKRNTCTEEAVMDALIHLMAEKGLSANAGCGICRRSNCSSSGERRVDHSLE